MSMRVVGIVILSIESLRLYYRGFRTSPTNHFERYSAWIDDYGRLER